MSVFGELSFPINVINLNDYELQKNCTDKLTLRENDPTQHGIQMPQIHLTSLNRIFSFVLVVFWTLIVVNKCEPHCDAAS